MAFRNTFFDVSSFVPIFLETKPNKIPVSLRKQFSKLKVVKILNDTFLLGFTQCDIGDNLYDAVPKSQAVDVWPTS